MKTVKSILIIGYANTYFRREYVRNIKNENVVFDILSFEKCTEENRNLYGTVYECTSNQRGKIKALCIYIKFMWIIIKMKKYDMIHIHFVKAIESFFAYALKCKCKNLISTIYGSDFYRISNKKRKQLEKIFSASDIITVATSQLREDFNDAYKNRFDKKIAIIPFGNAMYDKIDLLNGQKGLKQEFDVPEDSFVITIGYNATKEQNHLEILQQIKAIEHCLPENYYLLIPLGYGDEEYRKKIVNYFENINLKGVCLCQYYSISQAAKLRIISDIMIQLQNTDVLSNSMLEYIYAGNIVITGKWLPYSDVQDYIVTIDKLNDLSESLKEILVNYEEHKARLIGSDGKNFIQMRYTWAVVKEKWLSLYDC